MYFRRTVCLSLFLSLTAAVSSGQSSDSTRLWVRTVHLFGNQVTKPEVILREMSLRPGERLTSDAMARDRENIYNLQIFNRVDIDVHPVSDSADLYVSVDERWYFYPYPVVGIRHRDFSKLYYGAGVAHQNLRGWNQKLRAQAVTGYDQWVQLHFRSPRFLGSQDHTFALQLSYASLHPLGTDGTEYQETVGIAKMSVGQRFGLYRTITLTAGVESWHSPATVVRRTASLDDRDVFGMAAVTLIEDRRDVREYPMSGWYLYAELVKEGFGESNVDIVTIRGDLRSYIPVAGDWSVGVRGYSHLTTGGVVPSYRHAFFGYNERIRGSFSTVREGEGLAGVNGELRIPMIAPRYWEAPFMPMEQFRTLRYGLYGAVFVDAGKIWYRTERPAGVPLHAGAGVGLHFILPYGLTLRTDVAWDRNGRAEFVFDAGASF